MKNLLFSLIVIGVIFCVSVASCSPASPAPSAPEESEPAADKVLKVGVLGPFTGPSARVGEEFQDSVTMAFDAVDWEIGGYKLETVWIDSESDPEKGTRAYEQAILRDEIDCGLMSWHSTVAVPVMEVAAKYKIPHFFGFAATGTILEKYQSDPEKYSYWMGKTWPDPAKLTLAYVISLEDAIEQGLWQPAEKKVALYGNDTEWGRNFAEALGSQLEDAGWEIVATEFVPVGETDFYPLLTKLQELNVPLIAGTMSDTAGFTALIKQSREVELESLIIADGLGWIGEWYDLTGEASNYVLDQIPQWTTAEAQAFKTDFEERWGIEPGASSAGLAYDMANFFVQLAQATYDEHGELNSETLYKFGQEKLWGGEFTFTDGILMEEYKYTPETAPDPIVDKGYFIFPVIQYLDGEGSIVWPDEWKVTDLQVPDYMK
jgi:branched-chain amino acid transport system substrate-binding protein